MMGFRIRIFPCYDEDHFGCAFFVFFWVHRNLLYKNYMALFWNRIESSLASALVILVQLVEMHTW